MGRVALEYIASGWLKNNVQLVNGRWYKVGLIVNLDGKDVDVFPKWGEPLLHKSPQRTV